MERRDHCLRSSLRSTCLRPTTMPLVLDGTRLAELAQDIKQSRCCRRENHKDRSPIPIGLLASSVSQFDPCPSWHRVLSPSLLLWPHDEVSMISRARIPSARHTAILRTTEESSKKREREREMVPCRQWLCSTSTQWRQKELLFKHGEMGGSLVASCWPKIHTFFFVGLIFLFIYPF